MTNTEAFMISSKITLAVLTILSLCILAPLVSPQIPFPPPAGKGRIVITADHLLDGQGRELGNVRIIVEGSKIEAVEPYNPRVEPRLVHVDYDLRGLTVLPGWIDAHTHITWSFGPDGKNAGQGGTTQGAAYAAEGNAYATLMAGFTTIQSVGSPTDVSLRDSIASGKIPGPRILTAIEPLMGQGEKTGTPEEIRAFVRKQKEAGADLIKIYASGGMRSGPMTMSQEQLKAACDEAKKVGLRTLVHAMRDAVRASVLAGCTQVEHGLGASDDDLKLMAEHGTYFDPQDGLLLETYLANAEKYAGSPFYPATADAFAPMRDLIPVVHDLMRRASKTPGLKIVFGTDAVAGSHGRNAEDFIHRVRDSGVDPMAAMVSANSLGAEAMGMGDQIGSMAPGMQADIIALDGDPLKAITAVRRVVFVMKGGVVYKNVARGTVSGSDPALPVVISAATPSFPHLANQMNVHGDVRLRVSTDGEKVISFADESGPALLRQTTEGNIRTWVFEKHEPTSFEVTFRYHIEDPHSCEIGDSTVTMYLPSEVQISAKGFATCDLGGEVRRKGKLASEQSPAAGEVSDTGSRGEAAPQSTPELPVVVSAAMPLYPHVANAMHIIGMVHIRVSTDGSKIVVFADESGPPMLVQATKENLRTWVFDKHKPTTFTVTFDYRIEGDPICAVVMNSSVVLHLPWEVQITAKSLVECDPTEPIRHKNK
jgi:imidazolonepropionase-like amidohydrolase